jgi:colicin import membrane protein
MTAGIPDEMRRTVWVSLAAHVAFLALLSVVPFVKMPPMGASSIQVMLVSKVTAPAPPPPVAPQPESRPAEKASVPVPQLSPPPVTARQPEATQKRPKEVAAPKPVTPIQKAPVAAPTAPPKPLPAEPLVKAPAPPVVKPEPVVPKSDASQNLNEALRRVEEALMKANPTASKPTAADPPRARTSDEISKLLSQLPPVPPASPAPAVALAPQPAPRTVALERCPPKARAYCPLLEAAINRVWNADTDPGVRSVLESAGDSTATIRMVILPDGMIKEIQLSKSSGNDAYDRAVQSVLRELRHLPPLPADMKGEPFVAVTSFTYSRKRDS